mgnify:CR=1 FL=1
MNTEKITHRMGSTTVTQTAEGFELKNGFSIKIPPEVTFKDVKNETVLGDPNNRHITTGCIRSKSGDRTIYALDEKEVTP